MPEQQTRLPRSTYRLQFNGGFRFADATAIIDYLQELGISDLYASPLFLASPESTHGYDVCGFDQLSPNLGKPDEFDLLSERLRRAGLGFLLDMVPNHMGNHANNFWWRDVLEHGRKSKFANYFDINWEARSDYKILLPVLGDQYERVLERGELKLAREDDKVLLTYYENRFPVSPESRAEIVSEAQIEQINGSRELLHEFIQRQHYCLAFWRVGPEEINYRRFFDVTGLVSLRVEDADVFAASHAFVFELLRAGKVTGLRIDHPDGLRDPQAYFERLQQRFREFEPDASLYVVAEKILSDEERLPANWQVDGTTGYDYLIVQNGLFVATRNEEKFTDLYREFTGRGESYEEVAYEAKKFVLARMFPSEVCSLQRRLSAIAASIDGVVFTASELKAALTEFIAAFPVYRTYRQSGEQPLTPEELDYVQVAVLRASGRVPSLEHALKFLANIVSRVGCTAEEFEFVAKLQQLTGPATAKGLEDTAFYRYTRFVSLNEVGGNPGKFGTSVSEFHRYNRHKQENWPHSMLATATHDTKRGEDVRARLNVLSEMPEQWGKQVREWRELTAKYKGKDAPAPQDEYLLYQVLVGSWASENAGELEAYTQRIQQYMEKATRESKLHTSWTDPDAEYEEATRNFVQAILKDHAFVRSLSTYVDLVAFFGVFNSLAQVLLKICSPGVPDFYQGTELWDLSLVDPDNRRPIDYATRKKLLERVRIVTSGKELLENPRDGAIKMWLVHRALRFRQEHREVFESGTYEPIEVRGSMREHVIAFARNDVVVVVPRWSFLNTGGAMKAPLGEELWADTELVLAGKNPPSREFFTSRVLQRPNKLGEILGELPFALLY